MGAGDDYDATLEGFCTFFGCEHTGVSWAKAAMKSDLSKMIARAIVEEAHEWGMTLTQESLFRDGVMKRLTGQAPK